MCCLHLLYFYINVFFHFRERVVRFTYVVISDALVLNAVTETDLTEMEMSSALVSVSINGLTAQFYGQNLYTGDISSLVSKEDLCFLVVQQKVTETHYSSFESTIASAWQQVDAGKDWSLAMMYGY